MPIVAVLLARSGEPDLMVACPEATTFDQIHAALKRKLPTQSFRLVPLDVGDYEIGADNPRGPEPLPTSDAAIHRDAGTAITLRPRSLWKISRPGHPEQLALCATEMSEQDLRESGLLADLATLAAAEPGVYPIRQVLHSYRCDGRALDELGYYQMEVPSLPETE